MELNDIIKQKKEKLELLKQKGVPLFESAPAERVDIGLVIGEFQEARRASLCGRVMAKRSHGKVTFMDLKDSTGKIQLYFKADYLSEEKMDLAGDIDIADIISVTGELFKTHTGEPTLKVEDVSLLSKALRPLPEKWHGLKDVDLRYRQRYLDLIANEDVKKVFALRSEIIKLIRSFLDTRGFQEVETPMMHFVPGGAAGRPFKTFHNEYSMDLFLRIAPELYLKRLLVGGLDKVYEINRSFRNEGVSTRHNPEFTMLEVYRAYANYEDMMRLSEEMIVSVANAVKGQDKISYQGKSVDLSRPWQRISFAETVKNKFGILPQDQPDSMLKKLQAKGFAREAAKLTRSQVGKVIEDVLEQEMNLNPTFVTDYFASMSALAKTRKDNPLISERFELYIAGIEVGNAYSELNDPIEQKQKFEDEIRELGKDEQKTVDEDYVLALEHAMPPAGGLGIGIDRLVMLLADQYSIRDVILFPLLRPQEETE